MVLADDHEVIRLGLRTLLGTRPELEILGEAASGREAVAIVKRLKPMVVVMDLGMPRLNGTGRGDLYAEITVQLPRHLSTREKDLFAELARIHAAESASA